jgi:hypothetical protein
VRVRGFAGEYRVTTPGGAADFRIAPGASGPLEVRLGA